MSERNSDAVLTVEPAPAVATGPVGAVRSLPLHEQVQRSITERILSGSWPRGRQIPGEEELAALYRVSVGTVRRALGALVAEGLLARRRRHGTVVTDRSPHHSMRFLYHFYRLHRDTGELVRSTSRVLAVTTHPANDIEARRLQLPPAQREVIEIHRVRSVDSRPALHEIVLLPAHRFPDFPGADALPALMYVFFLERYGIRLVMARESLRADIATAQDAELLALPLGHPILEIEQVAYDGANAAVEWRLCRTVTDHFRYINEVR